MDGIRHALLVLLAIFSLLPTGEYAGCGGGGGGGGGMMGPVGYKIVILCINIDLLEPARALCHPAVMFSVNSAVICKSVAGSLCTLYTALA